MKKLPLKIASDCRPGTLVLFRNRAVELFSTTVSLIDEEGRVLTLYRIHTESDDRDTYIHPLARVSVIWEPEALKRPSYKAQE